MTFKEIQELLRLISKSDLTEFKLKDGEFELSIRTRYYEKAKYPVSYVAPPAPAMPEMPIASPVAAPQATAPKPAATAEAAPPAAAAPAAPAASEADGGNYVAIKSPMVGTFYRSPSPDKPAFIKVGDRIEVGAVVCVVEAMKLFNEIESEVSGRVVKVMVEDAHPIEYDQVLFLIDPKG